jgi:glycosyltransferase involved in cell wall biosynthesis
MTRPSVSVVVPCFRYADVLEGCVESVLSQEGVDVRVLIVDDHSPDHTPEVAGRLARRDARVEYRRHRENQGLIATANEGLAWADGDHVVLLSADDLLTPGALARAAAVMHDAPSVGMVYGRALFARPGRPLPEASGRWRGTDVWRGRDWLARRCRTATNCISSPEVVVRTAVQRAVGGYDSRCFHTSDLNMWLRIAAVADVAYVRGAPQAVYRVHPDSMLRSDAGPMVDLRERRAAFDCFFEGAGATLADAGELRSTAARALARQALWRASRAYDRGLVRGEDALPVDALVAFALDVHPGARRLREWQGLQLRRRIGERRSHWFPPFAATGAAHRLHGHARRLRWRLRGV